MSNVNQPVNPTVAAPGAAIGPSSGDAAVEAYRRAVEAKPTAFAENPIGAMASAMDKIGRAADNLLQKPAVAGQDGLGAAENRLVRANEAARANPNSLAAKQDQLKAAVALLKDMQHLAPNDPRRVKVAGFVVNIANQLGAAGIPNNIPGIDMRGLLRLAAQITSRFGDGAGMQAAFTLEGILKSSLQGSSVDAVRLRDALIAKFNLSQAAASSLTNNWSVRLTNPGEMPNVDISSRTLSLDAAAENPSLSVLARAYWNDSSLNNPADKDGFMQAFLKIANSGGAMAVLNRKFKELRRMAQQELAQSRVLSSVGASHDAPVIAVSGGRKDDESADMFAALAVFSQSDEGRSLPESMQPALARFFA